MKLAHQLEFRGVDGIRKAGFQLVDDFQELLHFVLHGVSSDFEKRSEERLRVPEWKSATWWGVENFEESEDDDDGVVYRSVYQFVFYMTYFSKYTSTQLVDHYRLGFVGSKGRRAKFQHINVTSHTQFPSNMSRKCDLNFSDCSLRSKTYSLPSINVNLREWIKVNIYRGVNN